MASKLRRSTPSTIKNAELFFPGLAANTCVLFDSPAALTEVILK
jgi:hypothetical protein